MGIDPKFIGKKWPPLTYEAGKEKIREFAKAIKCADPHFFDDEFAKKTKYGAVIAPPTFAVVYGAQLIEPIFYDNELNLNLAMLVHGEQEFEFYNVVKANDVLTSEATIANIANKEKLDSISIELMTKNQRGEDVCRGVYTFVVRK